MVEVEGFQNNDWVNKINVKRDRWVETFLRVHFLLTYVLHNSVREWMHIWIDSSLEVKVVRICLISWVDQALSHTRYKELQQTFKIKHLVLWSISILKALRSMPRAFTLRI